MKVKSIITAIFSLMILTGCASVPNALNSESRKHIKSVSVHIIPIDRPPGIYTPEQEIAGLAAFMFVGTQASADAQNEAAKTPSKAFGDFLERSNISIDKIVKAELEKQLINSGLFKVSSKNKSDAVISVKIGTYGFAQKGLWSSYQRSQLYLYADLYNSKDKKIMAKFIGSASPFRDEKAMTIEEIFKSPDDVRKSFEQSAVVAVKDIVERMTAP